MKIKSIEEKAKRYDEAIEIARQIHDADRVSGIELTTCEEIFPELAESENARIRKRIIDALHGDVLEMSEIKEAVSWLEKQGEQKPAFEMKTLEESLGIDSDTYNKIVDECIYGEHKPADKVEPKFKVGDTIRLKNSTAEYRIESISGGCYHGKGWGLNIIDADKSGDYELVEQKTAWSEEDNRILSTLTKYLEEHCGGIDGWECSFLSKWLKSLKDRVQPQNRWKPSEYHLKSLQAAIGIVGELTLTGTDLKELLEQLKKLK